MTYSIGPGMTKRVPLATEWAMMEDMGWTLAAAGGPYVWNTASGPWGTSGNWTPAGPPAAADTARFVDTGGGTVDLGGATCSVDVLELQNAAGNDFTFTNGTLSLNTLTQSGTGTNTIEAILDSASIAGTVSAGRLELNNPGNTIAGGTWTVSGGTLAPVAAGTVSGLGSADVVLSGGTLELAAGPLTGIDGIDETIFDGTISDARNNIEAFRTAAGSLGASDAQGVLTGHLHYQDDNAVSARAAALGASGFDNGNFAMLWVTEFTPNEGGAWGFRFNRVDDNASLWLDDDGNGIFEATGDRFYDRGCCGGSEFCLINVAVSNAGNVNVDQGLFRIEGSTVYTAPGKTINVVGGATLDFWNSTATHSPNVTLQDGANLSANGGGGPTLSGAVAISGTANVVTNNDITLSGQVTGGTINKTGSGTLTLTNAANSLSAVALDAGALRITNPGALGGIPSLDVEAGRALEFDGTMTVTSAALPTLTVNDGTLRGISGTATIDTPISTGVLDDVTFGGAGNLVITQGFGNGSTPVSDNFLNHYGFRRYPGDSAMMDLDNNNATGMMSDGDPTTHANLTGQAMLTTGPGGRGLDFNDDNDFVAAGVIDTSISGWNDNYTNLWIGTLHVDSAGAGNWEFRYSDIDDWRGMWLDLNQDGIFESSTPGLGSNRGEQLAWQDGGTKTVSLAAGDYLVAFTHLEGGGGSRAEVQFKSPSMGGQAVINPNDPAQAGLWNAFQAITPDNNSRRGGALLRPARLLLCVGLRPRRRDPRLRGR